MSKICKNVQKCNTVKASLLWKYIFKHFVTFRIFLYIIVNFLTFFDIFWHFLIFLEIFGNIWCTFQLKCPKYAKTSKNVTQWRLRCYGITSLNILLHWSRRACVPHTWWRTKRSWPLFSPTFFFLFFLFFLLRLLLFTHFGETPVT